MDLRNKNFFNVGGNGTMGYYSQTEDWFGSTDGKQYCVIGVATSGDAAYGIYCSKRPISRIWGNNTTVGGVRATQSGNSFTYQSSAGADAYAADGYNWIYFGWGDRVWGPTSTSNHIIGYLRNSGGQVDADLYGTNTIHGEICNGGADVWNYGAFILAGNGYNLTVAEYTIRNLPAGSLTYSSSFFTNFVLVNKSDTSVPGGRCLGGAYTEIDGGTLKVTSPGYFEARAENGANGKIPAGKYAWPLRYKSGTCDVGISTSGGKVRTLFGGGAVGRRITDMGRLVIYLLSGTSGDLQSYWMDKGPYGGWYLFDPGYWG